MPGRAERPGPLAGVRVIELGTLLAGPFTGRVLGDLGAEIIKVERPGQPDPMREWGKARYKGRSLWWPVQSRNKQCITLNLRSERGQELLLELVQHARRRHRELPARHARALEHRVRADAEVNPKLSSRASPGTGRPARTRERAGFASVAEAMGGLRYINGFPGEPPPRIHISLGDSLAGMFAAQGILAALYWRDATGGGGPGRRRLAARVLVRAAREHRARVRPARDRPRARRNGPEGRRALEHLQVERRQVDGDRGERRQRLPPAVRRDGQPELADDARFATHLARGDHQEEIEGDRRRVGRARTTQPRSTAVLNEAGVICGPIYTIADIFEDPQFRARDMLLEHDDPEFGHYIGPGIVPKLSETPGEVRWSATVGGGQPQPGGLRRSARALRRRARRAEGGRRPLSARHDLRRRRPRRAPERSARTLEPAVRAELVNRLAAAGLPRIEAVSFVSPARVPQMAGAEEVVAALERRPASSTPVSCSTSAATTGWRATGLDEVHFAFASTETFNQREPDASVAESVAAAERHRRARARRRHPRDGHDRRRVRLPVRRRGRPGPRARARRAARRRPAPTRSSSRTRSASACRGRCAQLVGEAAAARASRSASTCTTPATPASRTPTRRSRRARPCSTPRSAASAAARSRLARPATSHRGSRLPAPRRGNRDRHRPRRADRRRRLARRRARATARGQVYRAGTFAPVAG